MKKCNSKPSLLRRRYLINRPIQLAYSGFLVVAVALGMIITWLVNLLYNLVAGLKPDSPERPIAGNLVGHQPALILDAGYPGVYFLGSGGLGRDISAAPYRRTGLPYPPDDN